jgi:hypothetical protein
MATTQDDLQQQGQGQDGQTDGQDGQDDNTILDSIEEALREGDFGEQADRIATGAVTNIESIKGALLRDLRAADDVLADQVLNRQAEIKQAREAEEAAAEQARIEAEAAAVRAEEEGRQRRTEAGELTYADEHPVEYTDTTLPAKSKDREAFHQKLAEFGKHTAAWKADRWEQMADEERGVIAVGWGEPLHADLNGFTPKDGELSQLERQSLEAQAKAFKATKLFVDAPTLALVTETERQQDGANTRAESDAALQRLVHIAKGVEADGRSRLPFQTPYKRPVTLTGPDGEKTVVYEQRPGITKAARTADGGAIVTEIDEGTGQRRITEYSAEEYAEIKAQLMLEAPDELPAPLSGSTITDEFSRPLHDVGTKAGEATRVQVNPLAKNEGPSTPQEFIQVHSRITKADIKLWPADVQAKFNRDFPDAARTLLRGEEVTEL